MGQYVELRVSTCGEEILVYVFKSVRDAADMIHYLDGMLELPSFTVHPLVQ